MFRLKDVFYTVGLSIKIKCKKNRLQTVEAVINFLFIPTQETASYSSQVWR